MIKNSIKINQSIFILTLLFVVGFVVPQTHASFIGGITSTSTARLNSGLVGWWTFDGKDMVNGVVRDTTGNGYNGTLAGVSSTTSFKAGKIGQAFKFDGVSNVMTTSDIAAMDSQSAITVSAWINTNTLVDNKTILAKMNAGNVGAVLQTGGASSGGGDNIVFALNGSNYVYTTNAVLSANKWIHVVGTFDNALVTNKHAIYIDGVAVPLSSFSNPDTITSSGASSANFEVGRFDFVAGKRYWNGSIDDVRVYSRALSAREVAQLYTVGSTKVAVSQNPIDTLAQGLLGYWTLDGKDINWATNKATDKSGNGYSGTITNMSTTTSGVAGRVGQALKFDGVNDFVDMGTTPDITGNLSVSIWVKDSALNRATDLTYISKRRSGFPGWEIGHARQSSTGAFTFLLSTSTSVTAVSTRYSDLRWHHLVGVYDGSFIYLYVDGLLKNTKVANGTMTNSTYKLCVVGSFNGSVCNNNVASTTIDQIRIYDRALSQSDVTKLYNEGVEKIATTLNNPVNLSSGLVGWWTFDGKDINWATNRATDKSGNGNTGTITNMSTTTSGVAGKVGQGLRFDGSDDYVNMGDKFNYSNATDSYSFSVWIKTTISGRRGILARGRSGAVHIPYSLHIASDNTVEVFAWNQDGNIAEFQLFSATQINDNRWHQISFVHNGASDRRLYVDGSLEDSETNTLSTSLTGSDAFEIGRYNNMSNDTYFSGSIDDVRIYNRALSATEITQLYKMGK